MAKISVIIPVYNSEKYIEKCLVSIIGQTIKNIEIICVDDGSDDNSVSIIKNFTKNYPIKLIQESHRGAAAARNTGLKIAQGDYIHFIDSDDFLYTDSAYEILLDKLEDTDADFLIFKYKLFDNIKKEFSRNSYGLDFTHFEKAYQSGEIKNKIFQITTPVCWNKIYKTSFLKENKIEFQNLKSSNDLYFTYISLLKSKKFYCIEDELISYRINTKTSIYYNRYNNYINFYDSLIALDGFLKSEGIYNDYEKSFINIALSITVWNYKCIENKVKQRDLEFFRKVFTEFNFKKYDKEYFYYLNDYKVYKKLLNSGLYTLKFLKILKQIFSLRNDENYKILTLFGYNIKIKRKTYEK